MAKLKELVYDVKEAIKEFQDDTEIDNRYIIYLYNIKRAKYLRQELNNYARTADLSVQQSFCLEMELVNADDCGEEDCIKILRSVQPLPKLIELHTHPALLRVKPTSKIGIPFNFITKDKLFFLGGATFTNGLYSYLDDDQHIYIYSLNEGFKFIDCLSVTGIFENPSELQNYNTCCNCNSQDTVCYNELEDEYPLQPHFIDLIRKEIINELLVTKRIPEDYENNSTDER